MDDPNTWRGNVGAEDVLAQVGDVTVQFPKGVAPEGTAATVKVTEQTASAAPTTALSDVVEVELEGGLQPLTSVTITIPVRSEATTPSASPTASSTVQSQPLDGYVLLAAVVEDDGTESYEAGEFNPDTKTFVLTVDHFSQFKVLGVDIEDALHEVRTAITQGIGLEYPEPDCVGEPASVRGTKYEVVSPPGAFVCLSERNDSLVVSAYPAIAMPYVVKASPRVSGTTSATEVTASTSGVIAFAKLLGFIGKRSDAGLFPGAKVSYTFDGAPTAVRLSLEQYPALLLMVILAKTLDVLEITSVGKLEQLQCLSDVAESSSALSEKVDGKAVGAFVTSFMTCAGSVAGLSPLGRFLLAAIGTAPALLVTSVLGIINEFTGQARQLVTLTVTPPALPTNQAALNAVLPANTCMGPVFGWDHDSPIRLKAGVGEARNADGSFGGASVTSTEVLGRADLDGDGDQELVLAVNCIGSSVENCCAGRQSHAIGVVAFTTTDGRTLKKVSTTLFAGQSKPGDEFGPAGRSIESAMLEGVTVVTKEYIVYPEQYTASQVGGDPYRKLTVRYRLKNGGWAAS